MGRQLVNPASAAEALLARSSFDAPAFSQRRGVIPPGPKPLYSGSMSKADEERAKRLAEALRLNLRRRKAQARGETPGEPAPPAPPADEAEHG